MRLYCHPLSSNSRRVLRTAHHLGLDLELVTVDLAGGEHKLSDYLSSRASAELRSQNRPA